MIKLLGFLPDVDPVTSGAIQDCDNLIPTTKGMRGLPSPISAGLTAVSAETNSLVTVFKLDGTPRTFVGTETTIEEAGSGSWTDQSGSTYGCAPDGRWSFAQFGDYTLASNAGDVVQVSESTTFADIAGSPEAEYIAVSDGFVMAVNLSDFSDKWHCSAYLNHTDWTEAISTQCTSGRLIGGGEITGVKKFGSGFVAWKKNSTYIASYVGAPTVFQWDEINGNVGCPTSHASTDIGDRIAFLGNDDFYIFDGANNLSIGKGIREWFFGDAKEEQAHRTIATYNPNTANVTWHYVSVRASDDLPDMAVVFNVRSGKWGKYEQEIESANTYLPSGVTYEGLGTDYSTYDDLPTNISYDSPYWAKETSTPGLIKTDHILYTLTGTADTSSLTTNVFGDDNLFSTIRKVRPRFITAPEQSSLSYYYDDEYGDNFTFENSYNLIDGRYDFLHSSRWHKFKMNFSGNVEIISAVPDVVVDGEE